MSVSITKRFYFSCAHQYPGHPVITQNSFVNSINQTRFGSNFELFVSVSGKVNPDSGMVLPLAQLKQLILPIIDQDFDHHYLSYATSIAHISSALFRQISDTIPQQLALRQILLMNEAGEGALTCKSNTHSILALGERQEVKISDPGQAFTENIDSVIQFEGALQSESFFANCDALLNRFPTISLTVQLKPTIAAVLTKDRNSLIFDYWFSFPHQVNNAMLTDNDNQSLFGRCINCHGHNFRLRVTITEAQWADEDVRSDWHNKLNSALTEIAHTFESAFVGQLGTCEHLLQSTLGLCLLKKFPEITELQLRETENNFITQEFHPNDHLSHFH